MDIYVPVIIKLNRKFISSSINYFLKKKKNGGGDGSINSDFKIK